MTLTQDLDGRRILHEADLELILLTSPNAIVVSGRDGLITHFSEKSEKLFGYSRAEVIGHPVDLLLPDRLRDIHHRERQTYYACPEHRPIGTGRDLIGRRKDGTEVPIEIGLSPIETDRGMLTLASIVDISQRKLSETAIRESEGRYRILFDSNPLPMWVFDLETLAFLEVNDAAVRHYGYSRDEFLRMKISDIRPPEDVEALHSDLAAISSSFGDVNLWRHRKKDGSIISVEVSAHSIDFAGRRARLILANDVTERKALEDQLRQSQKMEAIGLLAGGIAHDFNNLLTAINGYSELSLRLLGEKDTRLRSNLSEIHRAGNRAASLTRQLLAFGRKQLLDVRSVDLNEIVDDLGKMLRRLIGEHIELKAVLQRDLHRIKADPGQVEQVILNLVLNARDAMPSGGTLLIETQNVTLDDEYASTHVAVRPGRYVLLAVTDTGVGMTEEVKERIFEPFFSTKEQGKGTGLGLSTTYGIVKQSGGNVWVYSEPGKGSTFKIYLPAEELTDEESHLLKAISDETAGTESILLVEDEKIVRDLAQQVLESAGYRVFAARDTRHALLKIGDPAYQFDLLLTDMVMPDMSGADLAAEVRRRRADAKILFMSGYTDSAVFENGHIESGSSFLQKPFSASGLLRKVREVLDSGNSGEIDR